MKKLFLFLSVFLAMSLLCGCADEDSIISSLPDYVHRTFHTSGGIQDFTDYAVYTYDAVEAEDLLRTGYFTQADDQDCTDLLCHIENFEEWVDTIGADLEKNYDFDKSSLSAGDYFYLITKSGQPVGNHAYGKFDHYTLYLFDVDSQTLFYFHHNI